MINLWRPVSSLSEQLRADLRELHVRSRIHPVIARREPSPGEAGPVFGWTAPVVEDGKQMDFHADPKTGVLTSEKLDD
jgi:hypothetical protein